MNKAMAVLVVVLCSASLLQDAFPAEKCKNKVDKTGVTQTQTLGAGNGPIHGLSLAYSTDGEDYYLDATYRAIIKSPPIEFNSDTPMVITFDDGSEVTVHPVSEAHAKRTFLLGAWNRKKTMTVYNVGKEDVEKLAAATVTSIEVSYRVEGEMKSEEIEIKPENREALRGIAGCVMAGQVR